MFEITVMSRLWGKEYVKASNINLQLFDFTPSIVLPYIIWYPFILFDNNFTRLI